MIINHNMQAINTHRQMFGIMSNQGKSMEKLSSGLRINRAGDDAAGLAISEKMRSQIKGLNQASRNSQDGISLIQTAEGALTETHSMLQRMRELTVQANNGTNEADDKTKIQEEIKELQKEITSVANKTEFNSKKLLEGSLSVKLGAASTAGIKFVNGGSTLEGTFALTTPTTGSGSATHQMTLKKGGEVYTYTASADGATPSGAQDYTFTASGKESVTLNFDASTITTGSAIFENNSVSLQVGANKEQTLSVSIGDMRATALGTDALKIDAVDVSTDANTFDEKLDAIDKAISQVSTQRSNLGAKQNRLEHTIKNLNTSSENLTAAESRIRDVDMAKEMMTLTKQKILMQASQSMLAQANQNPQGVLSLLR